MGGSMSGSLSGLGNSTMIATNPADFFLSVYAIAMYAVILLVIVLTIVGSASISKQKKAKAMLLAQKEKEQEEQKVQIEVVSEEKQEDAQVEEAVEEGKSRFYMLTKLDEERTKFRREKYDVNVTLKNFCESFRNFACSKLSLYYSIDDIRRFVAGIAVSKLIILQGISGTGKTSLANALGEFLDNSSTIIPVQPMWKERTDLVGYYNEFTKKFNETTLLQKMYEANYSKDIYVTVLDEMNIARVEYYFAEFLSLLELPNPEKRYLDVVNDKWANDPVQLLKGRIKLPENMWFIGTANNDDSTFAISDKVYDRAMVVNLDQKSDEFVAPKTKNIHLSAERFKALVKEAEKDFALTKRNQRRLEQLDAYMIETFGLTFGNRIMKQIKTYIPVFVACGGQEINALDDILSKKVMRKLEMQNPVYVRNAAESFCNKLDELFGLDKMKLCKTVIHRLEKNA